MVIGFFEFFVWLRRLCGCSGIETTGARKPPAYKTVVRAQATNTGTAHIRRSVLRSRQQALMAVGWQRSVETVLAFLKNDCKYNGYTMYAESSCLLVFSRLRSGADVYLDGADGVGTSCQSRRRSRRQTSFKAIFHQPQARGQGFGQPVPGTILQQDGIYEQNKTCIANTPPEPRHIQ